MPEYKVHMKDCGYRTLKEKQLEVDDFFKRHGSWKWENFLDCECYFDRNTKELYCDIQCSYYKECCGLSVDNKFEIKTVKKTVFEFSDNINLDDIKVGDIVYLQTYTKPTEKEFVLKVTDITNQNIIGIVYDGPIIGIMVDSDLIVLNNELNDSRKFLKRTIEQVKRVNFVEMDFHVKSKQEE